MKRTVSKKRNDDSDLLPEYKLDYSKMKPNKFAQRLWKQKIVRLDPDVAKVFSNGKQVNDALRAIVNIMPKRSIPRRKSA